MLDPAFVALFGTLLGGVLIKGTEAYLGRGKAGSISLSYDDRWSDPKYVKMIHKTRESEMANGMELTECECKQHTTVYDPVMLRDRTIRRPGTPTNLTVGGNRFESKWKTTIDGWQFEIPERVVPSYAHGVIERVDGHFAYGLFKWTDPASGRTKAAKVISIPKAFHAEFKPRHDPIIQYQGDGTIIMDKYTVDKIKTVKELVSRGVMSPNEARQELRELGL